MTIAISKLCSIEGCGRPRCKSATGFCNTHRLWHKAGKDMGKPIRSRAPRQNSPCSIEGCGRPRCRGMTEFCNTHRRWHKAGKDMSAPIRAPRRNVPCSIEGCGRRRYRGDEFCRVHHRWQRRNKDMSVPIGNQTPVGAVSIGKRGYASIKCIRPNGRTYWAPQHRHVMETHVGRKLLPTEVVHHKNWIRDDNRIENLQLRHKSSHTPGGAVGSIITWCIEFLSRYGKVSFKPHSGLGHVLDDDGSGVLSTTQIPPGDTKK